MRSGGEDQGGPLSLESGACFMYNVIIGKPYIKAGDLFWRRENIVVEDESDLWDLMLSLRGTERVILDVRNVQSEGE